MVSAITVVKCGGAQDVDIEAVCRDVAELALGGASVVLVHGGSAEIGRLGAALGVPHRVQVAPDGVRSRYTDEQTLRVVTLALAGSVKPQIVQALHRHGVRGLGLTGLDGTLLRARRKPPQRAVVDGRVMLVRDTLVGTVDRVDAELLQLLLERGLVPVLSPPAITADGQAVNVDADRAAAAVAAALKADTLLLLTAAPGVLSDPQRPESVLATCAVPLTGRPGAWAAGGMALKLVAAREALTGGVRRVIVGDGRGSRPVHSALAGAGTRIELEERA